MSSEALLEQPTVEALEAARARVAARAYELYLERGGISGHDFDDWLRAEAEVLERETAA
jgi:Protein of unknown function (DUF2934)